VAAFLLAAVVIALAVVVERGIWPAFWVKGAWRSFTAYVVTAPASFIYVLVIGVTTIVLLSSADSISNLLLATRSSTLHVLFQHPVRGFVQSAFWVATPIEFPLAILYATLLAPVERWLGSARWILVAAIGHVGATLLVAILIWAMVQAGLVGDEATRGVDVGVSYAFGAVAGVFAYLLHGRLRWVYPAVLLGVFALVLLTAPSFTAVGHILAILIGLGLGAVLVRRVPLPAPGTPLYQRPLWRP
jgi:hypothetical protein